MFTYEETETPQGIQRFVTGFEGEVNFLHVPEEADGIRVTGIAPHAFAGRKDITEVLLPQSVHTLGGFAFHNCTSLKKLTLHNAVTNYSDGVIKGCRKLEDIVMHVTLPEDEGSFEAVKRMLSDTDVVLRFRFKYSGSASDRGSGTLSGLGACTVMTAEASDRGSGTLSGLGTRTVMTAEEPDSVPDPLSEASLIFPDYLNEAQEDTRARAIHQTIEGAGYAYRECVRRTGINYREYDRLFDRVRVTAPVTAERVALERLTVPYRLDDDAKEHYASFLRERTVPLLLRLIAERDIERVRFLADERLLDADAIDEAIEAASRAGEIQMTAILMHY